MLMELVFFWRSRPNRPNCVREIGSYRRSYDVNSTYSAGTNLLGRGSFPQGPRCFSSNNILIMEYIPTMTFRTLVQVPSALHSPPPSAVSSTPSAINNLAKVPGGLWAVILVVVTFLCGGVFFFFFSKRRRRAISPRRGPRGPKRPKRSRKSKTMIPVEALLKALLKALLECLYECWLTSRGTYWMA